jgi:hypothetical protein
MSRGSIPVPAPIQGQSKAPDFSKLPGQVRQSLNFIPLLPDGGVRRAPLEWRLDLTEDEMNPWSFTNDVVLNGQDQDADGWAFVLRYIEGAYTIEAHRRDPSNPATALVSASASALAYLKVGVADQAAQQRLDSKSITGTTFIWNRQVAVANGSDTAPARDFEGLLWCSEGAYSSTYTVTITLKDGSSGPWTASFLTPYGGGPDQAFAIDTAYIIDVLLDGYSGPSVGGVTFSGTALRSVLTTAGFTIEQLGSVLYLTHATKDFTITTTDSAGDTRLRGIKDTVASFVKLPKRAVDGFKVKVIQDASSERDDYWVAYEAGVADTDGVWVETIAPGAPLGLDPETMPIAGTYDQGTNTWTFDTYSWGQRTVGDEELVEDPEFIGEVIQDVSFAFGRLVLIYAENVALSSAQDAGIFYATSIASLNPADPVYLNSTIDTTTKFLFAVPANRRLLVCSTGGVFEVIANGGPFSLSTADIKPVNATSCSAGSRPFLVSNQLYLLSDDLVSGARTLYEISIDGSAQVDRADPLNIQEPKIFPEGQLLVATIKEEYATLYAAHGGYKLVLHMYRYAESGKRIQNALVEWEFPQSFSIASVSQEHGVFSVHLKDAADNLHYFTLSLERKNTGRGTYHNIHLDGSFVAAGSFLSAYDGTLDQTVVTLPYQVSSDDAELLNAITVGPTADNGDIAEGSQLKIIEQTSTTITIRGDVTALNFVCGVMTPCWLLLPRPYAKNAAGGVDRSGILTLSTFVLEVIDTGHVEYWTMNLKEEAVSFLDQFAGLFLNDAQSSFDTPVLYDGSCPEVGVFQRADEFYLRVGSTKYYPLTFVEGTWYALNNQKAMAY